MFYMNAETLFCVGSKMIPELEKYVNSKKEFLEQNGVKVIVINNSEIVPKCFKMNVLFETNKNLATFTVWEKGSELPVEADIIVVNVPTRKTTISKTILPKQFQELVDAFEELTDFLMVHS